MAWNPHLLSQHRNLVVNRGNLSQAEEARVRAEKASMSHDFYAPGEFDFLDPDSFSRLGDKEGDFRIMGFDAFETLKTDEYLKNPDDPKFKSQAEHISRLTGIPVEDIDASVVKELGLQQAAKMKEFAKEGVYVLDTNELDMYGRPLVRVMNAYGELAEDVFGSPADNASYFKGYNKQNAARFNRRKQELLNEKMRRTPGNSGWDPATGKPKLEQNADGSFSYANFKGPLQLIAATKSLIDATIQRPDSWTGPGGNATDLSFLKNKATGHLAAGFQNTMIDLAAGFPKGLRSPGTLEGDYVNLADAVNHYNDLLDRGIYNKKLFPESPTPMGDAVSPEEAAQGPIQTEELQLYLDINNRPNYYVTEEEVEFLNSIKGRRLFYLSEIQAKNSRKAHEIEQRKAQNRIKANDIQTEATRMRLDKMLDEEKYGEFFWEGIKNIPYYGTSLMPESLTFSLLIGSRKSRLYAPAMYAQFNNELVNNRTQWVRENQQLPSVSDEWRIKFGTAFATIAERVGAVAALRGLPVGRFIFNRFFKDMPWLYPVTKPAFAGAETFVEEFGSGSATEALTQFAWGREGKAIDWNRVLRSGMEEAGSGVATRATVGTILSGISDAQQKAVYGSTQEQYDKAYSDYVRFSAIAERPDLTEEQKTKADKRVESSLKELGKIRDRALKLVNKKLPKNRDASRAQALIAEIDKIHEEAGKGQTPFEQVEAAVGDIGIESDKAGQAAGIEPGAQREAERNLDPEKIAASVHSFVIGKIRLEAKKKALEKELGKGGLSDNQQLSLQESLDTVNKQLEKTNEYAKRLSTVITTFEQLYESASAASTLLKDVAEAATGEFSVEKLERLGSQFQDPGKDILTILDEMGIDEASREQFIEDIKGIIEARKAQGAKPTSKEVTQDVKGEVTGSRGIVYRFFQAIGNTDTYSAITKTAAYENFRTFVDNLKTKHNSFNEAKGYLADEYAGKTIYVWKKNGEAPYQIIKDADGKPKTFDKERPPTDSEAWSLSNERSTEFFADMDEQGAYLEQMEIFFDNVLTELQEAEQTLSKNKAKKASQAALQRAKSKLAIEFPGLVNIGGTPLGEQGQKPSKKKKTPKQKAPKKKKKKKKPSGKQEREDTEDDGDVPPTDNQDKIREKQDKISSVLAEKARKDNQAIMTDAHVIEVEIPEMQERIQDLNNDIREKSESRDNTDDATLKEVFAGQINKLQEELSGLQKELKDLQDGVRADIDISAEGSLNPILDASDSAVEINPKEC